MRELSGASLGAANTSLAQSNGSNNETYPEQVQVFSPPLIVLFALICLLIISANGLIIYLICRKKTLRSITNMFLTSLALSDLVFGLAGFPLLAICSFRGFISLCVSSVIFIRFTAISSVCHVLLIACDRYVAIIHPMQHPSLVTKRRAIIATFFVWLFAFAVSIIQLSWYGFNKAAMTEYKAETENIDVVYSKTCIVLFFVFPLVLMCYVYGRIFYISFKHIKKDRQMSCSLQQAPRSLRHEWRGKSVLLIMMVIFIGCWLPFFLTILEHHKQSSESSPSPVWLTRLLVVLRFIPPLSNPLLCTMSKHDFRSAVKAEVLQKILKKLSVDFRKQRSLDVVLT